jgi:hypothetical protein
LQFSLRNKVASMNEIYPFEKAQEAYERMMSGEARSASSSRCDFGRIAWARGAREGCVRDELGGASLGLSVRSKGELRSVAFTSH